MHEPDKGSVGLKNNQNQASKVRPFNYVSEEVAQVAENFCQPLKNSFSDLSALIPHIGQAFEDYKRNGGEIPSMISMLGTVPYIGGLNFQLTLEKVIVKIFDTAQDEIFEHSYNVAITIYKRNGKSQIYRATVEGDKIKGTEWIKRATQSLARVPSSKEEKQEYQNMVQDCIETEGVPMEIIYPTAG